MKISVMRDKSKSLPARRAAYRYAQLGGLLRVAALALCLIGAQWAGLVHRIEHRSPAPGQARGVLPYLAGKLQRAAQAKLKPAPADRLGWAHDCAAFDAAALGSALAAAAQRALPLVAVARAALAGGAYLAAAPEPPFHSRAPPRG